MSDSSSAGSRGSDAAAVGIQVTRRSDAIVRVVAGGNHVTNILPAAQSGGVVDAIRVRADPGGGPPPHRRAFGEWFHVEDGTLQITGEHDGQITLLATVYAGDSVWVPPNVWHGTVNGSDAPVRFLVIGVPGVMTGYFERAGIIVPDEQARHRPRASARMN
jgi:quercetin dioxygenase-like cupin family protein